MGNMCIRTLSIIHQAYLIQLVKTKKKTCHTTFFSNKFQISQYQNNPLADSTPLKYYNSYPLKLGSTWLRGTYGATPPKTLLRKLGMLYEAGYQLDRRSTMLRCCFSDKPFFLVYRVSFFSLARSIGALAPTPRLVLGFNLSPDPSSLQ